VPSVTTIIGRFGDKSNLINWAYKVGLEQAEENERRTKEGLLRLNYDLYREGAADVGTIAHKLIGIDVYKKGIERATEAAAKQFWIDEVNKLDKEIKEYDQELRDRAFVCFGAYQNWASMTHVDFEHIETAMVSNKHKFGGCLDAVGTAGGKRSLLDFKSSKKVWWDYYIQLAAYSILWHENYPDRPLEGGYHILRFSKNGDFAHHHLPELRNEAKYFLALRELFELEEGVRNR